MILEKKLTIEEQNEILGNLFGFQLKDYENDGRFILYDEEGLEFYGKDSNLKYDFSTLSGIFHYVNQIGIERGEYNKQLEIKRALGL